MAQPRPTVQGSPRYVEIDGEYVLPFTKSSVGLKAIKELGSLLLTGNMSGDKQDSAEFAEANRSLADYMRSFDPEYGSASRQGKVNAGLPIEQQIAITKQWERNNPKLVAQQRMFPDLAHGVDYGAVGEMMRGPTTAADIEMARKIDVGTYNVLDYTTTKAKQLKTLGRLVSKLPKGLTLP